MRHKAEKATRLNWITKRFCVGFSPDNWYQQSGFPNSSSALWSCLAPSSHSRPAPLAGRLCSLPESPGALGVVYISWRRLSLFTHVVGQQKKTQCINMSQGHWPLWLAGLGFCSGSRLNQTQQLPGFWWEWGWARWAIRYSLSLSGKKWNTGTWPPRLLYQLSRDTQSGSSRNADTHSSSLLRPPSAPLIPTSLQVTRYSEKFLLFTGEYVKLFHY